MRLKHLIILASITAGIILLQSATPQTASTNPLFQSSTFKIRDRNPVVNEGNPITLVAVDGAGQPVSGVTWESGSPDIASVDSATGTVRGVSQGYATVTARRGSESDSVFVTVSKLSNRKGVRVTGEVTGDLKVDTSGAVYFSDPFNNVIFKRETLNSNPVVFAGQMGITGKTDGNRQDAQFAGPTAISIDNRPQGGIYIADTLNHNIRKISFADKTETVVGRGTPGINMADVTPFDQRPAFSSPQGASADIGGSVIVADTDNHAIYIVDFEKREVRLLAGSPGLSGKADGKGRAALFSRPTAVAVQAPSSKFFGTGDPGGIFVADTGNNRVRFISREGEVTTVGPIPKAPSSRASLTMEATLNATAEQTENVFVFDAPTSVSVDAVGNVYVVDAKGANLLTKPAGQQLAQMVSLGQAGASFGKAANVVVDGNEVLVLDGDATSNDDAVKVVTVGAPEIISMSRASDSLAGGNQVIVTGKNFAPESLVVLGDTVVTTIANKLEIESATRISFNVPAQNAPGRRTISIQTRGGLVQREFRIAPKAFNELAAGEITTVAGGVPFIGDSGLAVAARFSSPQSVLIDSAGNIVVADAGSMRIRRISTSGVVNTIVGSGASGFSGDGGPALSASLSVAPTIAMDGSGNLYLSDRNNHRVRRVDASSGVITTFAGSGANDFRGDGGPAVNASLSFPEGIIIDGGGNLFIADSGNSRIRKVDASTRIITTAAGNGNAGFSGDGGPAVNASIKFAEGVGFDGKGDLLILDRENFRVRRVDSRTGIINTIIGNGKRDFGGDGGPALNAGIDPASVAADAKGNLFIADLGNSRIRRVDAVTGVITSEVGNGRPEFSGDGGQAINAGLFFPAGAALDGAGNIIIADQFNDRIRRVDARTGIISTIGGGDSSNVDGGSALDAILSNPFSAAVDRAGNLIVADTENARIRKVDVASGIITNVAGTGNQVFSGDGGPALNAGFEFPSGVAVDAANNIIIADSFSGRIRRVDAATGVINTIAGNGEQDTFSGDGGPAVNAALNSPFGVAVDRAGNIFIADTFNFRVRRVDAGSGIITTIAGNGGIDASGDGGKAVNAGIGGPIAVAFDGAGNLFILDAINSLIRRVDTVGTITTVAGNGTAGFSGDGGQATRASFSLSFGLAADSAGNVFIADTNNDRIRRVDGRTGIITTFAGTGNPGYSGDGGQAASASFSSPKGVTIDGSGNVFIAAGFNNAVRAVKATGGGGPMQVTITSARFVKPNLTISGSGFGASGATVRVNGTVVSAFITSQSDTTIVLKGSKKKFALKKGANQVTVSVNGVESNVFTFNF